MNRSSVVVVELLCNKSSRIKSAIDDFRNCYIRIRKGVNIQLRNMLRTITTPVSLISIAVPSIDRHVSEL